MFSATAKLKSTSPYSPSRQHTTPKKAKESANDYDLRTWKEKATYNDEGNVVIPRMAFKFALINGAAYLGEKVQGKGMKTWTGYFTSAVHIQDDLTLPLRREDLQFITLPCHANGNRKSGKRVPRTFPVIPAWAGSLCFDILDPTITEEIFTRVLQHAGMFIGIGRFRPENGGFNGRFVVEGVTWKAVAVA